MDNDEKSKSIDKDVADTGIEAVSEIDSSDVTDKTVLVNTIKDSSNGFDAKPKKKKKIKLIIASIVIGVLLILGGSGWLVIKNNPTHVFKSVINDRYKDFSKSLNSLNDSLKDIEQRLDKDVQNIDLKVSFKDGIFEEFEDTTINARLGIDKKKKEMEISASLNEDGEKLLDGAGFIKDDTLYVHSETLLDGSAIVLEDVDDKITDELGFSIADSSISDIIENIAEESDMSDEELEFIKHFTDKKLTEIIDTKLIDKIAKDGKDALIKSLDKEQMEKTKETIDINDLSVKTNKYTYNLNKASIKELMGALSDNIKDDKDLIKNISELTGIDKDTIKDAVKEIGNKDNYDNLKLSGEFSVYTTTVLNSPIKYELILDDVTISYSEYKGNYYVLFKVKGSSKDQDVKFEIVGTPQGKQTDIKVKYDIQGKSETILKGTVTKFNEKEVDFDVTLSIEDFDLRITEKGDKKGNVTKMDYNGWFSIKSETKIEKDKITITETIDLDLDEDELEDLEIDLNKLTNGEFNEIKGTIIVEAIYSNDAKIADYDVDDAKNIEDFDEEDLQKNLEKSLDKYKDSKLIKFFMENMEGNDLIDIGDVVLGDYVPSTQVTPSYDKTKPDNSNSNYESIYDNQECWDAYMDDLDYDGFYAEYYEEYCR